MISKIIIGLGLILVILPIACTSARTIEPKISTVHTNTPVPPLTTFAPENNTTQPIIPISSTPKAFYHIENRPIKPLSLTNFREDGEHINPEPIIQKPEEPPTIWAIPFEELETTTTIIPATTTFIPGTTPAPGQHSYRPDQWVTNPAQTIVATKKIPVPPSLIKLNTGEYIERAEFNKLNQAQQSYIMKNGVKIFNDERYRVFDLERQQYEEAWAYWKQDKEDYQKWVSKTLTKLSNGDYVRKTVYEDLFPIDQKTLNELGVEKYNQYQEEKYEKDLAEYNLYIENNK
jgi:hypothetical protein